jgi:hypothetical protein
MQRIRMMMNLLQFFGVMIAALIMAPVLWRFRA